MASAHMVDANLRLRMSLNGLKGRRIALLGKTHNGQVGFQEQFLKLTKSGCV